MVADVIVVGAGLAGLRCAARLTDLGREVSLHLDPPERALLLCVDEKNQIQALDRTAPIFPMRPGLPERRTADYIRPGPRPYLPPWMWPAAT